MTAALVSVIVPTYNRAYCVPRTIKSALAQTHGHIEILVIDDGSQDDTRDVIRAEFGDEPRVKYVYQDNTGVSGARNHGLRIARGEFIALLDSDDIWHPWKLEVQLAALRFAPEAGLVSTDMEALQPDGHVSSPRYLRSMYEAHRWFTYDTLYARSAPMSEAAPWLDEPLRSARMYTGDIFSPMIMGSLIHTSTVVLRRELAEKVGGYNPEYTNGGEDYDFHLRACRLSPVAFVDVSSIQYQRGLADRITRPETHLRIATNFLKTISRAVREHHGQICLSKQMLNGVFAEAHGWIGELALDRGHRSLARQHLVRSLWFTPGQSRIVQLLALACLPQTLGSGLRSLVRMVKAQRNSTIESPTREMAHVYPL